MMDRNKLISAMHLGAIDAGHDALDADAYERLMRDLRQRYYEEDDSVDQERLNLDANGWAES